MSTFLIGLAILIVGGLLYGKLCEKVFKPDASRQTPAYALEDGVDYIPMKGWKNSLINLLNIAGTGPILGPIQGILFGPIAFILIPIGNILGGSMHDYFSGMISIRENGAQMPGLVKKYTNKGIFGFYEVFVCLLLLLVGAVFVYTPGDIMATQVFGFDGKATSVSTWVIYAVIFAYYLIATLFPIDAIIGRIYPIFGAILIFSAVGIFGFLMLNGSGVLYNLGEGPALIWQGVWPVFGEGGKITNLIPAFFLTVACGIVSGFHSTQNTIIARSVKNEKQGLNTFYNMMVVEGFIAMCWAAAAMYAFTQGWNVLADGGSASATSMVGIICKHMLGPVGGIIAIIGVIVLPITSGDTALRGMRLILAEFLHIDQKSAKNRYLIAIPMFIVCAAILIWSKSSPNGFNILWRYFAWANQTISIFAFALITIYLIKQGHKIACLMSLIPGIFYTFVTCTYIINAKIGFNVPQNIAYVLGLIISIAYAVYVYILAKRFEKKPV